MLDLVRDLALAKGVNVIVSSHLLPDIEYTCSFIVVMDKGQVVTAGPIAGLKQTQGQVFELRFKIPSTLSGVTFDSFLDRLRREGLECHATEDDVMRVFVPGDEGARKIFAIATAERVQIRHLRPSVQTLEDVFAKAVGER
jgi:ABC-2 type transport system ATP-binding protein